MCEKKLDDVCWVVCRVIVLSFSEELLKLYIMCVFRLDNEVEVLMLVYREVLIKSLKM